MFVTIINDCGDQSAMARQTTRLSTLFPGINISTIGIENYNEIEASGNLIDTLDASSGEDGVILVNAAPRHKKKWPNGTPFGYFWFKKTLIISTVDGATLSLAKKFNLLEKDINLTDVPTVVEKIRSLGKLDDLTADTIIRSQFRSFDYLPRLARWILDGIQIPFEILKKEDIENVSQTIWHIDNFGNAKTTLVASDLNYKVGDVIKTKFGEIEFFNQLRDVPVGSPGITIGSSGFKDTRFLEIVVQGQSAKNKFGLQVGMEIL